MKYKIKLAEYKNRDEFERTVKEKMKYYECEFDIDTQFHNCMAFGYAVVKPVCKQHRFGMLMTTNLYRDEVIFTY